MTFEWLGEMFEGDSADTPVVSMGGRAEGLACTDPGARTPIGMSGIFLGIFSFLFLFFSYQGYSETSQGVYSQKKRRY